jgi:hypothetical protein
VAFLVSEPPDLFRWYPDEVRGGEQCRPSQ